MSILEPAPSAVSKEEYEALKNRVKELESKVIDIVAKQEKL